MKILILWKYYSEYLERFYEKYPQVINLPFVEHRKELFNDHFGWPADLNRYMNQRSIQTEFLIVNDELLQKKWAIENGFSSYSKRGWEKEIAMEQIKSFYPDILWIGSMFDYFGDFVNSALPYCKKTITWISCDIPRDLDVSGFNILVTSHPHILKNRLHLFEKVLITKPGFDPDILKKIGNTEKNYDVTFIGGITSAHKKRCETLAYLVENGINLQVFGILPELSKYSKSMEIIKFIPNSLYSSRKSEETKHKKNEQILKSVYKGPVFGLDAYRILASSFMTVNAHGDVAKNYSGNMRMFESTGVGTCLITENHSNVNELFEPQKEILTYESKEDLLDLIKKMLKQKETILQIGKAGQKRTLKDHTIERMFNNLQPLFEI